MTSLSVIGSVLEVGLVVVAAVIFLTLIATVVALIVWSVGGIFSATHQDPAAHH